MQADDCTWHPVIRWLLFIPLAVVASGVAQALLRWANADTPVLAELLSRAAEPWIFFYVSLWILPKFHIVFMWAVSVLYVATYCSTIYFTLTSPNFSADPWVDYAVSGTAVVSCILATRYFLSEEK